MSCTQTLSFNVTYHKAVARSLPITTIKTPHEIIKINGILGLLNMILHGDD